MLITNLQELKITNVSVMYKFKPIHLDIYNLHNKPDYPESNLCFLAMREGMGVASPIFNIKQV